MKVAAETVVELHYSLHLGDGAIVDRSSEGEPLTYLHGQGQIVPGLERALEGLDAGETKQVVIPPGEGYGARDPAKVRQLPLEVFGGQPISVGEEFIASDPSGAHLPVKILAIENGTVTVDFNHPLAGQSLHFSVTVNGVRPATAEELEHGHAHGAGGHEH